MAEQEAVLIHLDGSSLADEVYEQHDLATLEEELIAVLDGTGLGEYDGNEFGPESTTLFLYGADANALFAGIEQALRANPLCQNARVEIRAGAGASVRDVRIPMSA